MAQKIKNCGINNINDKKKHLSTVFHYTDGILW